MHTPSQESASSRPELNCNVVEESTTEEESEDECEEGFTPHSGEFDKRRPACLWSPHTPRLGKREGRGRGKQVILSLYVFAVDPIDGHCPLDMFPLFFSQVMRSRSPLRN